ncbi:hypothetical protein [Methylobacter tundripaludum]|uniref:hypothetical protein n=1 Tax=Methylobacter tundripaludum TaxID=173365 RepID=UPI0001E50F9D|nr:hypothetical protein [Methylobacter tundripaludum]
MNELKAIAAINEEIKSIVYAAENISLTATNAMLVARQAGTNAVGFSVVARELRTFSENMATAMQSLSGLIDWQVEVSAGSERNKDFFAPACVDAQADRDEIEQLIVSQVCELQIRVMRTAKQCATGLLIAQSVDMETSPGGTMTLELRRITQEVEERVGNIALSVRKLESRLAEAGLWKNNDYLLIRLTPMNTG